MSIFIQPELEFGVSNDDTFAQCVFCTFFIESNSIVKKFLCEFLTSAREIFLEMFYTLLERNIFIVVTDLGFG